VRFSQFTWGLDATERSVPEDVEPVEAGDLFVEKTGYHVGEELMHLWMLIVAGGRRRLEVEHETDGAFSDNAAQSAAAAGQPVQPSLIQRHRLGETKFELPQYRLRHYDLHINTTTTDVKGRQQLAKESISSH